MPKDTEFVQVSEILSGGYEDKDIYLRGWIYRTRSSGKIVFASVRDSSGTIQIIVERENVAEEHFQDAKKALVEATLKGQKSWNYLIHRFTNAIAFFKRNDPWKNINLEKEVILWSSQIAEFAIYELRR